MNEDTMATGWLSTPQQLFDRMIHMQQHLLLGQQRLFQAQQRALDAQRDVVRSWQALWHTAHSTLLRSETPVEPWPLAADEAAQPWNAWALPHNGHGLNGRKDLGVPPEALTHPRHAYALELWSEAMQGSLQMWARSMDPTARALLQAYMHLFVTWTQAFAQGAARPQD